MTEIQKENKSVRKVPNLRFPEFEGEWETIGLGEICEMKAGKFVSASEIIDKKNDDLFPCYGGNGLRGYTKSFNKNGRYPLIGRQGALCGNVTLAEGKFYATEHAVIVTPYDKTDITWLYYLFIRLNLNQYATGMAQPGLSVQNLLKIKIVLPPTKPEQEKCASILELIDRRITTQNKIINDLKTLKNTTAKKVFSQELKFKSNTGSDYPVWEIKKIKDVGKFSVGGDLNKLEYKKERSKKYTYPIYANSEGIGLYGYASSFQYPENCVTVSGRGNLGVANVRYEKFCAIVRLIVIHPHFNIHPKYLQEIINTVDFAIESTGVPQLTVPQISNYLIAIPCFEEQTKISDFLSAIESKIDMETKILKKLEVQKKFLLQQMFV